ncbi:MAG: RidA family protein [Ardenticatenaceae bacterium]|nr:RidA family protein [Ardenticatenaceae bacterium]
MMKKETLNPKNLFNSVQYGFSQIVTAAGGTTVYLSGQVGWDENERLTGDGSFEAQTRQSFKNIEKAMQAAGGQLTDVLSLRIYFLESQRPHIGRITAALKEFFSEKEAPATTWIAVTGLAREELLIEIEAIGLIA